MSEPLAVPSPAEIAVRIRACREELAALRRLHRVAKAAEEAHQAREKRTRLHAPANDVRRNDPATALVTAECKCREPKPQINVN